jgi:hypothetical protein
MDKILPYQMVHVTLSTVSRGKVSGRTRLGGRPKRNTILD